jgi:hypothetical protein
MRKPETARSAKIPRRLPVFSKIRAYAFEVVISPWISFSDPPREVGQNPLLNLDL